MTTAVRKEQGDLHPREVCAHRRHPGRGRPPQTAVGVDIRVVRRMDLVRNQAGIGRAPPREQDRVTDAALTARSVGKAIQDGVAAAKRKREELEAGAARSEV